MPTRSGSALLAAAALMQCEAVHAATAFPILSSAVRLEASGPVALSGGSALVGNQVFVRSTNGWVFQQTLDGSGPAALDGNTAVVGNNIYARLGTNWTLQGTLSVRGPLALDRDTIAIGVIEDNAVHIYVRTGPAWAEQAVITGKDLGGYSLGWSVALSGNNLVVGAAGYPSPSAYVYSRSGTNWVRQAKLGITPAPSDGSPGYLCISGNTLAIGESSGAGQVSLFVNTNGTWTLQQRIAIAAGFLPSFDPYFPVSLIGNTLAVADLAGAVHIFTRRGTIWREQQQLTSEALNGLGPNLALGTNALVVNAPGGGSFVYQLQALWQSTDIGVVGLPGNYTAGTNTLFVSGAGDDIGGNADACHFVFQPWNGDLQALVKVTQTEGTDDWARGGIMFRASLEPGAAHAFISLSRGGSTSFQARTTPGGDTLFTNLQWVTAPYWLKLVKIGNTVTAYDSLDAGAWWKAATITMNLPQVFYVGFAVTSHTTNSLATVRFEQADFTSSTLPSAPADLTALATGIDQIQLTWSNNSVSAAGFLVRRFGIVVATLPARATSFTDTGLFANTSYSYTVQPFVPGGNTGPESAHAEAMTWKLPASWQSQDVGSVTKTGDAYFNDQGPYPVGFMVSGTGHLADPVDSFHFVFQPWTGDFDFRAYAQIQWFDENALDVRAGLMVRASLAPDSPYAMLSATEVDGDKFVVRGTNSYTSQLSLPNLKDNGEFRLVRRGNTLSAFHDEDGALVLVAQTNTDLPETLYLGFAVAGRIAGTPAEAEFSNVYLAGGNNVFPLSPPIVSATAASDSEIDISWTNSNPTTTQFVLEQWPPAGNFPHTVLATLSSNTAFFADTNLSPLMTEHYRLRVQLEDGDWLWSSPVAATTLPPPPGLPPPWQSRDVGPNGVAGFATVSDTYGFSVYGAGGGAGSEDGDSFQYAFWKLDGDGYIKARLANYTFVSQYEELGLMLRQSLDPTAASAFVFFTPFNGMGFLARPKQGARVIYPGSFGSTPRDWFKLDRKGNYVTGYISRDGQTWESMGTANIALTNTVLVGLMVSSAGDGLTVGTFNPIQIGPAQPPVLFLSAPRTDGTVQVQVGSLPGWMNAVQVSPDLVHWSLCDERVSTSGFLSFTANMTTANPRLFYRAVILP